ncbi:MAG: nucleotide exchange factor GrpE [Candidatus Omnitrophica bacterium]|nr:nucleotide exchange factor GrpE [Candidatus Omnitrophota bacterium]
MNEKEKHSSSNQPDDPISIPREQYEKEQAKLKELEGLKDQLLRSAADFENAKKRLARERDEFARFSQENLIRSLLPVLDNFERALAHVPSDAQASGAVKGILTGIEMVRKQLLEILKAQGLERIHTLGQPFDPHRHEAIAYVYESGKPDHVVEEIESGYLLHGRLLRAAKVKVRALSEDSSKQAAGPPEEKQEEIT